MGSLTFLLTGPGALLANLLAPFLDPVDDEAWHHFTVTLGLVFWLVLLLIAGLLWPMVRRRWGRIATGGSPAGAIATWPSVRSVMHALRESAGRLTLAKLWGAAWRAEAVHLALYVLVPALFETARMVLFIMFLPLTVMGVGEKRGMFEGTFDHLARPVCWVFVSYCPSPAGEFRTLTPVEVAQCQQAGTCPHGPVLVRDGARWQWKLLWAALAVPWIVLWWRTPPSRPRQID